MALSRRVLLIVGVCAALGVASFVMGPVPSRVSIGPDEQGVVVQNGSVAQIS
jgi:hypothetical protein